MLERLIEMILEKSFQLSDSPTFKLASGKLSNYYINCKPTTLNPEAMNLIGTIIFDKIKSANIDAIGGLSFGADPIANSVAIISYQKGTPIKSFSVRERTKDHGRDP
jgi:orotate phosphoribosyltransferase